MSIIIGIDYDEPKQDSYRAVTLHMPDDSTQRFEVGNPTDDMRAAYRYLRPWLEKGWPVMGSSSMDHFIMDGSAWDYLPDAFDGIEVETLQPMPTTRRRRR